jgi:hypothetical protein
MRRWLLAALLSVGVSAGCAGGVKHDDPSARPDLTDAVAVDPEVGVPPSDASAGDVEVPDMSGGDASAGDASADAADGTDADAPGDADASGDADAPGDVASDAADGEVR